MSFDKGKQSSNQVNRNESPIGRLKRAYDYWQSIKANDHVLGIIKDGYKIPFLTEPEECILKNNKSALDHSEFVESEISN
jgi:hypothetical protein